MVSSYVADYVYVEQGNGMWSMPKGSGRRYTP